MAQDYEVYGEPDVPWELADPARDAEHDPDSPTWQVLVEYSNGGQTKPPTVVNVQPRRYAARDEALAAAERTAFEFRPPDPLSPRGRSIFRDGPEGFLVVIEGAMSTFHMSVRLVQHVGEA